MAQTMRQWQRTGRMVRSGQQATSRWRALPDYVVMGVAKGGTSSLYGYLGQHPLVQPSRKKEINYFNRPWNFDRGERWYRSWFPTTASLERLARSQGEARAWTGDVTPGYSDVAEVPVRLHQTVPEARLVMLLREPGDRAWSHFRMRSHGTGQPDTFLQLLEAEVAAGVKPYQPSPEGVPSLYLWRGRYADMLQLWYEVFPVEQLLLVRSEDLFDDPAPTYRRICEHIGLPDRGLPTFDVMNKSGGTRQMPAELRSWLDDYYAEPNQELAELTGGAVTWPDQADTAQPTPTTSS